MNYRKTQERLDLLYYASFIISHFSNSVNTKTNGWAILMWLNERSMTAGVRNKFLNFTTVTCTGLMFRVLLLSVNIRKQIDFLHSCGRLCIAPVQIIKSYKFWNFKILKFNFNSKFLNFESEFLECWLTRSTLHLNDTMSLYWEILNWKKDIW